MHNTPSIWTLFQVAIDCFLIFLIVFFLIILFRERKQRVLLKEWILKQTQVFRDLVQSSDQKAENLSQSVESLIERLRREIDAAQAALDALEKLPSSPPPVPEGSPAERKTDLKRPPAEREAIRYLLKKGMKPLEISRQLNIPIGEVELVSDLESSRQERA